MALLGKVKLAVNSFRNVEKLKKYLETLVNGDPFRLKNLEDLWLRNLKNLLKMYLME